MTSTRLAVVIVNWNGTADTLACIAALRAQLGPDDRILVADNGSATAELTSLRDAAADSFALIENGTNLGFAGATNRGVRRALELESRWVLWWNNDALPHDGCIDTLIAAAEALDLAAAQPLLVAQDDPERIDSAGLFASRGLGASDWLRGRSVAEAPTEPTPILGPCGAAALFRADALHAAGLMDDALFVLCEDLDQGLRIAKRGGRAMLIPAALATHRRGVSDRPEAPGLRRRRKLWLQRNAVALGLRDWPTGDLLLRAPLVAWRMVQALWLARGTEFDCLPMWRRYWAQRRESRRAMRKHCVDTSAFGPPRGS